jgi:hypothetical protein
MVPTAAHICPRTGSLAVYIMVPNVACIGPQTGPLVVASCACARTLWRPLMAAAAGLACACPLMGPLTVVTQGSLTLLVAAAVAAFAVPA